MKPRHRKTSVRGPGGGSISLSVNCRRVGFPVPLGIRAFEIVEAPVQSTASASVLQTRAYLLPPITASFNELAHEFETEAALQADCNDTVARRAVHPPQATLPRRAGAICS
jgi:hypothetical protein